MTLFPVSITEAIDPAGFNRSDFIRPRIYEATPGTNVLSQHACDHVHSVIERLKIGANTCVLIGIIQTGF